LIVAFVVGVAACAAAVMTLVPDREVRTVVRETPLAQVSAASKSNLSAQQIYRRDSPGVVYIAGNETGSSETATGSGFVISNDGEIVTNAHVIEGISTVYVQFEDDEVRKAEVIGQDDSTDLALLKIDTSGLDLHPLTMGDSREVTVGDPVLALGNPFGLERTLTQGIVSAVGRSIPSLSQKFQISGVIQTDAAVNPGNSGGPLLDRSGRVIGINSQIQTADGTRGNVGIAFAIPINTAKKFVSQLNGKGQVTHAYLGVTTATVTPAMASLNLGAARGALVQSVSPGSPAAKAGLHAGNSQTRIGVDPIITGGDVITAIGAHRVASSEDVSRLIEADDPGDKVKITVRRGQHKMQFTVTLANRG
jgi:S1-C subfamily serine protease